MLRDSSPHEFVLALRVVSVSAISGGESLGSQDKPGRGAGCVASRKNGNEVGENDGTYSDEEHG